MRIRVIIKRAIRARKCEIPHFPPFSDYAEELSHLNFKISSLSSFNDLILSSSDVIGAVGNGI